MNFPTSLSSSAGWRCGYYGLRKHGDDVEFIVTDRDDQRLKIQFPENRKDIWGDFGMLVNGFELFRSIYKFDHRIILRQLTSQQPSKLHFIVESK